jgi:hypothetical protein
MITETVGCKIPFCLLKDFVLIHPEIIKPTRIRYNDPTDNINTQTVTNVYSISKNQIYSALC